MTATYYKSLETGTPHNGRRVKIDYSQSASPHDRGRFNRGNLNDGTRDIGNTQGPVLLFRGLDPLSGPQAIYQAMLYSSGPAMQGAKGMKRIVLIKDKVTMASFGFAFVEFVDVAVQCRLVSEPYVSNDFTVGFRGSRCHHVAIHPPCWISDFGPSRSSIVCSSLLVSAGNRFSSA